MAVEFRVRFENGTVTVMEIVQGGANPSGASGTVSSSKQLGSSFPSGNGAIGRPRAGQGGVGGESIDPSKGNPPPPPPGLGPGGVGG